MAMIVIGFFTGLVLVAVDSVYVCYSFDLDAKTAFKEEIHYVYNDVTGRQPVVIVSKRADAYAIQLSLFD